MEGLHTRDRAAGRIHSKESPCAALQMLVSHPNVTYLGRFRHQLWKVSTPAGEANSQGPQPKTAAPVTSAQKQKEQPHTARLRFWLSASASSPRALLNCPASSQNPCISTKHQAQEQNPSWLQDQYLHLTLKFQSERDEEAERRSRTKRHLPPPPQQPAAVHREAKESWCRGEPGSSSPRWDL